MNKEIRTNKWLVGENGTKYRIFKDGYGEGVHTSKFLGVTSGQSLIYLEQINMKYFTIEEKIYNTSRDYGWRVKR